MICLSGVPNSNAYPYEESLNALRRHLLRLSAPSCFKMGDATENAEIGSGMVFPRDGPMVEESPCDARDRAELTQ